MTESDEKDALAHAIQHGVRVSQEGVYLDFLDIVFDALRALGWQRVPEGCIVVPREATEEYIERLGLAMHSAKHLRLGETWPVVRSFYHAMITAGQKEDKP